MGSKLSRILLITIIALIILLIVARLFYNWNVNRYQWEEEDRIVLTNNCIDGTAHYGVRFPSLTKEYCECSTDSIIANMKKGEYLRISTKSMLEQQKVLLPYIQGCYNRYQTAIFENTELGEP